MTDYIATSTDLTAVADAIREKGGTQAPLTWPQGYIDAVDDLSPAPVASVPSKDVDFYDYDGTRVYSYTAAEFAALTEMPANPDHSGDAVPLTAQGWNWSLTDAKAYVASYGGLVIGQTYIPTDGKTHILITIPSNAPYARRNFILYFGQTVSRGVTVDWGDGTSETFSGTTTTTHTHQYTDTGDYDITLAVTSGSLLFAGATGSPNSGIYGPQSEENSYRRELIHTVYIGSGVTSIGLYALSQCDSMRFVTIPNGVTSIENRVFETCRAFACAIIPNGVTSIGEGCFVNDTAIQVISLPNSITTLNSQAFAAILLLNKITIPEGVTDYPTQVMNGLKCLRFAPIPNTVTSLGRQALNFCFCLTNITVPSSVTSIGEQVFQRCNASEYHFRRTTPPTLANANAFAGIASDCIIYVPRGSLNAYKTATNWSTWASKMQEEPA